jgi:hypothetical protein
MNNLKRSFQCISTDSKSKKYKTNAQDFKESFDKIIVLFNEMNNYMDKHPNCLTVEFTMKKYMEEHEVIFYLWKHNFTNTRYYCCNSISKKGLDFSWQTNVNDMENLKIKLAKPMPLIVQFDWMIFTNFNSSHSGTFF